MPPLIWLFTAWLNWFPSRAWSCATISGLTGRQPGRIILGTFWAALPFPRCRLIHTGFLFEHSGPSGSNFRFAEGENYHETPRRLRGARILVSGSTDLRTINR